MGLIIFIVSATTGIFLVLTLILWMYLTYISYKHTRYFCNRGMPYSGVGFYRVLQFVLGKKSINQVEIELYQLAKKTKSPLLGFSDAFVKPGCLVADLELSRRIFVKDFDHFPDRRKFGSDNSNKIFMKMVGSLEGSEWKGMRSKLSPVFTTSKIKRVFEIFKSSADKMCYYIEDQVGSNGNDFDVMHVFSKFAMNVIASSVFAIDGKSFDYPPNQNSPFDDMGKRLQLKLTASGFMKLILILAAPKLADFLGIQAFDTEATTYFSNVIKEVMAERRRTGKKQDDFLQLMMDTQEGLMKNEENSKESMEVMTGTSGKFESFKMQQENFNFDDDAIISNCVQFLLAGFDTLQSVLIFAAYQLALSQDVQEKLFEEVRASIESNVDTLTNEGIHGMSYLDMFINEILRVYPPVARVERVCAKTYKVPETEITIEKGTVVGLPVVGVHHDPEYYDRPEKFDPERFHPTNKSKRHPYSFLPFGHGPRNCIGMRFALTEVKTAIATLVYKLRIEPCSKTEIPIQFGNSTSLRPKSGTMYLKFTPRQ